MKRESSRDRVFAKRLSEIKAFEFNHSVAGVFEDMISRSVPGYPLLLQLLGLYADLFVQPDSRVYDLGCSLGAASRNIAAQTQAIECEIIALDNSPAMIDKCIQAFGKDSGIEWRCEDIRQTPIENASMVVLNLTLQFLAPSERAELLRRIWLGLKAGGVLVLAEKIELSDERENERMVQLHQAFKKTMGYSDLEISQKRSALENVLVPDTGERHFQRLEEAGFAETYQCFRCFNFVSYLAIKA